MYKIILSSTFYLLKLAARRIALLAAASMAARRLCIGVGASLRRAGNQLKRLRDRVRTSVWERMQDNAYSPSLVDSMSAVLLGFTGEVLLIASELFVPSAQQA